MTKEEAKAEQARISEHFDLGHWYGVRCRPCCDVYPAFRSANDLSGLCWYECPVCGKKSTRQVMPWLAEEAWNRGDFQQDQISWF